MTHRCPVCGGQTEKDLLITGRSFYWKGKECSISGSLSRLLRLLYNAMPNPLAIEMLGHASQSTLHVQIGQLRYAMTCHEMPYYIATVHGYGYVMLRTEDGKPVPEQSRIPQGYRHS